MSELDELERKERDLVRCWQMAEETRRYQEADRLLAQAEAIRRRIDKLGEVVT